MRSTAAAYLRDFAPDGDWITQPSDAQVLQTRKDARLLALIEEQPRPVRRGK